VDFALRLTFRSKDLMNTNAENKKPDWDTIFKGKENKIFSVIILDNKIIPSDIY
jgi:hypothetical protein